MLNKVIEEIEQEFEEKFYPIDKTDILIDNFKNGVFWGKKETLEKTRPFLHSSLLRLISEIKKEIPEIKITQEDIDNGWKQHYEGYNEALKEIHQILE